MRKPFAVAAAYKGQIHLIDLDTENTQRVPTDTYMGRKNLEQGHIVDLSTGPRGTELRDSNTALTEHQRATYLSIFGSIAAPSDTNPGNVGAATLNSAVLYYFTPARSVA